LSNTDTHLINIFSIRVLFLVVALYSLLAIFFLGKQIPKQPQLNLEDIICTPTNNNYSLVNLNNNNETILKNLCDSENLNLIILNSIVVGLVLITIFKGVQKKPFSFGNMIGVPTFLAVLMFGI
jgi:hypothetical protein